MMASHSFLDSRFPVSVPYARELTVTDEEFAIYVQSLKPTKTYDAPAKASPSNENQEIPAASRVLNALNQDHHVNHDEYTLAEHDKVFTGNQDIAHKSAGNPIVNAFYELKSSAGGIEKMLNEAWALNPDAILKIIFTARSIHLGKADKDTAYRALGWLFEYHPQTFLANLIWLVRPVIGKMVKKQEKKAEDGKSNGDVAKAKDDDDDFEMIDKAVEEGEEARADIASTVLPTADAPLAANTTKNDVKYGVAHGCWKDLANLLLLAVNDQLKANADIDSVLKLDARNKRKDLEWDAAKAKAARHAKQDDRHSRFEKKFGGDEQSTSVTGNNFRALHLTIARLFASQLRADVVALNSKGKKAISMAAKWCPSPSESHDKQTFIVTSIAEALFSLNEVCPEGTDPADRFTHLKHARLALRTKILAPLRKHLAIVERDITDGSYTRIKYERVPSLAMDRYSGLFFKHDEEHFGNFLERVRTGKTSVSGAILLPSTLVAEAKGIQDSHYMPKAKTKVSQMQNQAKQLLLDGQWKSLVKRIKDSGEIKSAIAVCDVSHSMSGPRLSDGTCPMDSAIGLSLLLAELAGPPFGGNFITFSEHPTVQKVGGANDTRSFEEKVRYILTSDWSMNTNFVSVFTELILPIAVKHKLKPEEMVKQIFVFSDMQFDRAQNYKERWSTSFERVKMAYTKAGYEMPALIFWNLAHGTKGAPVKVDEHGVSLVSGYSQGMMKVFLDGGLFKDEVVEEVVVEDGEDRDGWGGEVSVRVEKKVKKDPLAIVKKAISHPAYAMLKVVD